MIHIGQYIEAAIEWLTDHFAPFFDVLNIGIGVRRTIRRECRSFQNHHSFIYYDRQTRGSTF